MFRELQDSADAEQRSTMQAKSFAQIVFLDGLAYQTKVSTWHFTTERLPHINDHINDPDCSVLAPLSPAVDES